VLEAASKDSLETGFRLHLNTVFMGPFRKRVLISHTLVASATDDNQIIKNRWPALGFGHIVAALKIKDGDSILTPGRHTFSLKGGPHVS